MSLAERIRQYAIDQYVAPARAAGAREIEVRAGDIRQRMALENPIQAVCSAIETQRFQATANVEMLERRGPTYGADVTWRFSLVPSRAPDATPFGRRMVHLPVLAELRAIEYGLFPGDPHGSGIAWEFQPGLSLIAGINGLGKTTLLTMILRSFTGPYDLSGDGVAQSLTHLYHAPTQFLATSYGYDIQNRRVALQLRAQGSFRRLFFGSLPVRGRCPGHRR